jgi:Putative abortive phage resistance protein AbiGi, antitoxin
MLSSNTLFHFTDSAEKLISILRNDFYPRHSLEKLSFFGLEFEVAFPMVCFCDIPLSQIRNHIETYGSYGIGMSKAWADKNGLNPVLYLRPRTEIAHRLYSMFDELYKEERQNNNLLSGLRRELIDFVRYVKPYEGDLMRKGELLTNVRFYDEREWRYVPSYSVQGGKFSLTKEAYQNPISKANADAQFENEKLSFEPNDIRYLVIKEEAEIWEMVKALKLIKVKYSEKEIETLTSRILTCEQIKTDM